MCTKLRSTEWKSPIIGFQGDFPEAAIGQRAPDMQTGVHGGKPASGVEGLSDTGAFFRGILEAASSLMALVLNPHLALLVWELPHGRRGLQGLLPQRHPLVQELHGMGLEGSRDYRDHGEREEARKRKEAAVCDPGPSLSSLAVCGASYFNLCHFLFLIRTTSIIWVL